MTGVFAGFAPENRYAVDVFDAAGDPLTLHPDTGEGALSATRSAGYYVGSASALALVAEATRTGHAEGTRAAGTRVVVDLLTVAADACRYLVRFDDDTDDDAPIRAVDVIPEWDVYSLAVIPVDQARALADDGRLAACSDDEGNTLDDAAAVDSLPLDADAYDVPTVQVRARWEFAE
jgi:hypothetical protein